MKRVHPVQIIISIKVIYNYRKNISWLSFNNEPRVQKRQEVKDQQLHIAIYKVTNIVKPVLKI